MKDRGKVVIPVRPPLDDPEAYVDLGECAGGAWLHGVGGVPDNIPENPEKVKIAALIVLGFLRIMTLLP